MIKNIQSTELDFGKVLILLKIKSFNRSMEIESMSNRRRRSQQKRIRKKVGLHIYQHSDLEEYSKSSQFSKALKNIKQNDFDKMAFRMNLTSINLEYTIDKKTMVLNSIFFPPRRNSRNKKNTWKSILPENNIIDNTAIDITIETNMSIDTKRKSW